MKKILVMLAAALALGLFASCENGAKDVNIVDDSSWGSYYEYNITGTFTEYKTTLNQTTGKYDLTKTDYTIESGFGGITEKKKVSNFRNFELWGGLNYKATSTATSYSQKWLQGATIGTADSGDINISKLDSKYYIRRNNITNHKLELVEVSVTGNLTDKEFTVSTPGDYNSTTGAKYDAFTLKITRK